MPAQPSRQPAAPDQDQAQARQPGRSRRDRPFAPGEDGEVH